jgi:isopentenyl-diphosphate Delta-isomerase
MTTAARPLALLASASAALGASRRLAIPPSRLLKAAALALRGRRSFAAAAGSAVMGKDGAVDADARMDPLQRRLLFEDE